MSTLSVTTVCFILLLACFQPWTLADLHPNLQPQIQKQFSSEACEPPCAHCKLPSLPWKLLKPFCDMSGLTVISGGVYWELPLLLLFIVMRQIAGKQARLASSRHEKQAAERQGGAAWQGHWWSWINHKLQLKHRSHMSEQKTNVKEISHISQV